METSGLRYVGNPGSGNSRVSVSKKMQVYLNNEALGIRTAEDFRDFLCNQDGKGALYRAMLGDVTFNWSNRKTRRTWGVASIMKRRLTLYRHSLWVFLHECGHFMFPRKPYHGKEFGLAVDDLYTQWVEFTKTKKVVKVPVTVKVSPRVQRVLDQILAD